MKKSILMIVTNDFVKDPRVKKEALSLQKNNYDVYIVAWNRDQKNIIVNDYRVFFSCVKAGTEEGLKKIFKILFFWKDCWKFSKKIKLDFVHCHDLDTLPIGYLISKHRKAKLIYDSHESYPDQMENKLPKLAVFFLRKLEKYLIKRCDVVITVGERLADSLRKRGGKNVQVVGNWKDEKDYTFSEDEIKNIKFKYGIENSKLVVCYAGGFYKERNILPLIDAVKELEDATLILAGMGSEKEIIEKKIKNAKNIKYLGEIPSEKIPEVTIISDVIYYCLNENNKNSYYSSPNKLFEAIAGGKAMIARRNIGEIGEIVEREEMGILIDNAEKEEIQRAIIKLFDNNFLLTCQKNSKKLFKEKYNWKIAEEKLLNIYRAL